MAMSTTVSKRTLFEDARLSVERRSLDGLKRILADNACLPFLLDDEQKSDLLAGAVINGDVAVAEFLILMFGADPGANNNCNHDARALLTVSRELITMIGAVGYACEKGDLAMVRAPGTLSSFPMRAFSSLYRSVALSQCRVWTLGRIATGRSSWHARRVIWRLLNSC